MLDFSNLYDQYVESIYRYHLARTGDGEAAEDLTAETFHTALEERAAYRPEQGSPSAWLAVIARYKLAGYLRRGERGRPASAERAERWTRPAAPTREEALLNMEMARVAGALRSLPSERAEAVALHYFAGLSIADLAVVLGRREEAARKLVLSGLPDLRKRLLSRQEMGP